MANETKCACSEAPRLIFACSGASDLGRISDLAARTLTKDGVGKMYCLAGIGGRVGGIIENTKVRLSHLRDRRMRPGLRQEVSGTGRIQPGRSLASARPGHGERENTGHQENRLPGSGPGSPNGGLSRKVAPNSRRRAG